MLDDEGLTAEQRAALVAAEARMKPIRRAAAIATVNGWTLIVFGALTALLGLGSVYLMVVGVAVAAVGWRELRARDRLRALDPDGAKTLGWNQIVLLAVVAVYCVVAIVRTNAGGSTTSVSQLEELAGLPAGYVAELTTTVYLGLLVVVCGFQALMARFHFARVSMLQEHLRDTPRWVEEVQGTRGA